MPVPNKKLYIVVNSRLTKSQRIPQSTHAVVEFMHKFGKDDEVIDWVKNHQTIVCLHADCNTIEALAGGKETCTGFHDIDIPWLKYTAMAFWPTADGTLFTELKLA